MPVRKPKTRFTKGTKAGVLIALVIIALTVLAPTLVFVGCTTTGITARSEVLLPTIASSWPSIRIDIDRGIDVSTNFTEDQKFTLRLLVQDAQDAIESGDATRVSFVLGRHWQSLEQLAIAGIEARVEVDGLNLSVASSLRERVSRFGEAVAILGSRLTI